MREFNDLLEPVKLDGRVFTPIKEIAKLAFNYHDDTVCNNSEMWINESYDMCVHYVFSTELIKPSIHTCYLRIDREFNINIRSEINHINHRDELNNQVKIFNLLKQLNFI